jgi:hypothetical protein
MIAGAGVQAADARHKPPIEGRCESSHCGMLERAVATFAARFEPPGAMLPDSPV